MKIISKVFFLSFFLLLFVSCKNNADQQAQSSDGTVSQTSKSSASSAKGKRANVKAPKAEGKKRVLFVGNSHTEYYVNITDIFQSLCKENGKDFEIERFIEMGASMDEVYSSQKSKIIQKLSKADDDGNYFDYVLLQEKTGVTIEELDTYKENVKTFVEEIHKKSPGTVVLLYELMNPFHYKNEKSDFDYFLPIMKENALDVRDATPNCQLLRIGTAVKEAYEGKHGYKAFKGDEDLLRHGNNTLHMLNDAGFLASVLLYETILKEEPKIPTQLPFSDGINAAGSISLQAVDKAVSNKEALMKISRDNAL